MKNWFKDDLFKSVLKNAGKLGSTKLIGAIMGLIALIATGRGLRPHDFGALTMIGSYIETVSAIGQFQSWQIVLHYASVAWQKRELNTVVTSIRFAIALDICAGIVSMAGGILALLIAGPYLNVHPGEIELTLFYCTLIPSMGFSSIYGILRLFDRVDIVSSQQIVTPFIRGILCLIAWVTGCNLTGFVIAWYIGALSGQLYMWVGAVRELHKHNLLRALKPSLFKASHAMPKGLWSFVWTASLTMILETVWEPVSKLLVGKIISTSAAGLYSLSMEFLDAVQRPAKLLEKSYYPEVVRMNPRTTAPWKLAVRTSLLSAALGIVATAVVYIGGKPVISIFGHKYGEAATLMMWMSPGLIFFMAGLPLEGVLYTAGRAQYIMLVQLIAVLFYIPLLVYMGTHYGLNGAGLAYALGTLLVTGLTFALTGITFLQRRSLILPHERESH